MRTMFYTVNGNVLTVGGSCLVTYGNDIVTVVDSGETFALGVYEDGDVIPVEFTENV